MELVKHNGIDKLLVFSGRASTTSSLEGTDNAARLYTPSTDSWEIIPTYGMDGKPQARYSHTSFVFNGSFYLVGGFEPAADEFAQGDIWRLDMHGYTGNPYGNWRRMTPTVANPYGDHLPDNRYDHTTTLMTNQSDVAHVLLYGGIGENGGILEDPYILTVTPGTNYEPCNATRANVTTCVGEGFTQRYPDDEMVWWKVRLVDDAPRPGKRRLHAATTIRLGGKGNRERWGCVYIYGGKDDFANVIYDDIWRLCPETVPIVVNQTMFNWTKFTPTGSEAPRSRFGHEMTTMSDNRLFVVGGSSAFPFQYLNDVWEFDFTLERWVLVGDTINQGSTLGARRDFTIAKLDGTLFVYGGRNSLGGYSDFYSTNYTAQLCKGGRFTTYCDSTGDLVCIPCAPGYFSGIGDYNCTICPAGTWQNRSTSNFCYECPRGKYSTVLGATNLPYTLGNDTITVDVCTECPAGRAQNFTAQGSNASCLGCIGGYVSSKGSAVCTACPEGRFSLARSENCSICSTGTYSLGAQKNCTECPAGRYGPYEESNTCYNCPKGHYSEGGNATCGECPTGRYNPVTQGAYKSSCLYCQRGRYSDFTASISCTQCLKGKASNVTGAKTDTCTSCALGRYAADLGTDVCDFCPRGTYGNSTGATVCADCPTNTYSPTLGARNDTACLDCPGGTTSLPASDGPGDCQTCGLGKYSIPGIGGGCEDCPRGRYTNSFAQAARQNCSECPPGTFADVRGTVNCTACEEDTYSYYGYYRCLGCGDNSSCVVGPNGETCSGNGECSLSICSCDAGWDLLDCSVGTCAGCYGYIGIPSDTQVITVDEGKRANITIYRTLGTDTAVSALLKITAGNATGSLDYDNSQFPLKVTFADGETEVAVAVDTFDDFVIGEGCEFFRVEVVNATNGASVVNASGLEGLAPYAEVYITENDHQSEVTARTTKNTGPGGGIRDSAMSAVMGLTNLSTHITVTLPTDPSAGLKTDIMFLVDLSAGMVTVLKNFRTLFASVVGTAQDMFADDLRFGLATFVDKDLTYLGHVYGTTGDYEYQLEQALTSTVSTVQSAANALATLSGGDGANAQLSALFQVAKRSTAVGWRSGAQRIVVVVTSSTYHEAGDYPGGAANNLDTTLDDEDYVGINDVADIFEEKGVYPIFLHTAAVANNYTILTDSLGFGVQGQLSTTGLNIVGVLSSAFTDYNTRAKVFTRADTASAVRGITPERAGLAPGQNYTVYLNVSGKAVLDYGGSGSIRLSYRGDALTISLTDTKQTCYTGGRALDWAGFSSGAAIGSSEDDIAYVGWLGGFWRDEELRWTVQAGGPGNLGGSFSVDKITGPFGDQQLVLNMSSCDTGQFCGVVEATMTASVNFDNIMPIVFRAFSKSEGASVTSRVNYTASLSVKRRSGDVLENAKVLNFSTETETWQYQAAVLFSSVPITDVTATLRFAGTGTVYWADVGLYTRSDMACQCDDGFYANAGDTNPDARACQPKPECRFDVAKCTYCPAGYECSASSLVPCTGKRYSFGGKSTCSNCKEGWICDNGLTTPCAATNQKEDGTHTICQDCPRGHYCANGIATPCRIGRYSQGGYYAEECVPCQPGQITNTTGAWNCTECPGGTTSNYGRNACFECQEGEFSKEGQHPCQSCPPGTYSTGGAANCTSCPIGRYAARGALWECTECGEGLTTLGRGSASADDCI